MNHLRILAIACLATMVFGLLSCQSKKKEQPADVQQETTSITDFTLPTPDGGELSLLAEAAKHKITIVDFWASWCGPCRQETPFMVGIYEKYKDQGLQIVGISLDQDYNAWVEAISQLGMTWPQMSDLKGWEAAPAREFQVNSIPHFMVINQKGQLLVSGLRGPDLEAFVANALNAGN